MLPVSVDYLGSQEGESRGNQRGLGLSMADPTQAGPLYIENLAGHQDSLAEAHFLALNQMESGFPVMVGVHTQFP